MVGFFAFPLTLAMELFSVELVPVLLAIVTVIVLIVVSVGNTAISAVAFPINLEAVFHTFSILIWLQIHPFALQ